MSLHSVFSSLHTRSDAELIDPSFLRLFISEGRTAQYFNVALATVLVYHSIITLDKEVKFFWPNPWSPTSIIYFANRYIGLLAAICGITAQLFTKSTARSGLFSVWAENLANLVTILLIDYILLIRVLALYHQDKKLSIILKTLLGLNASLGLGLLIQGSLFEEIGAASLTEGVTVCVANREPPLILAIVSWLVPMTYGLILLCLALYKAAEYWRISSGFKGFHLVRVLIQDQVIYYGFVIFCSVCQIINDRILEISPFAANVLGAAGSPTLLCILGGQLLINLKEAGERGANGGTNYTPTSVSDIEFGEGGANEEQVPADEGSV